MKIFFSHFHTESNQAFNTALQPVIQALGSMSSTGNTKSTSCAHSLCFLLKGSCPPPISLSLCLYLHLSVGSPSILSSLLLLLFPEAGHSDLSPFSHSISPNKQNPAYTKKRNQVREEFRLNLCFYCLF